MAIIKCSPVTKNYLWGGHKLKERYNVTSDDMVAESWVISCHPDGPSIVEQGEYKGKTLPEYIALKGKDILGTKGKTYSSFPLLIKLLDANQDLSIQVHPDDTYAMTVEKEYGKNEMWLVLETKPEAAIYYGVKEVMTKESFKEAIDSSTIIDKLNIIKTKPYDFFYLSAGTIHGLGKGNVIAEIQQSSNSTYRIFDFNRKDASGNQRPLHIQKAMDVSNLHPAIVPPAIDWTKKEIELIHNEFFKTHFLRIQEPQTRRASQDSFQAILVIKGQGRISDGITTYDLLPGNGLFVEANTTYEMSGDLQVLIAEV